MRPGEPARRRRHRKGARPTTHTTPDLHWAPGPGHPPQPPLGPGHPQLSPGPSVSQRNPPTAKLEKRTHGGPICFFAAVSSNGFRPRPEFFQVFSGPPAIYGERFRRSVAFSKVFPDARKTGARARTASPGKGTPKPAGTQTPAPSGEHALPGKGAPKPGSRR